MAAPIEPHLGYSNCDLWPGVADRARPPRRRASSCPAEKIVLRGSCRTRTLLRTFGFFVGDRRSRNYRAAHLAERPRQSAPYCRQPACMGGGAVWFALTSPAKP